MDRRTGTISRNTSMADEIATDIREINGRKRALSLKPKVEEREEISLNRWAKERQETERKRERFR